jgi:hypothetical protein
MEWLESQTHSISKALISKWVLKLAKTAMVLEVKRLW